MNKPELNRRDFLKLSGGVTAGGLIGTYSLAEFLAACSPSGSTSPSNERLTIGIAADPTSLDTGTTSGLRNNEISKQIVASWTRYELVDAGQGFLQADTSKFVGMALKSMTADPDGKTYHFTVRQGLKFPSTGNPMTADDFYATIKRYFDLKLSGNPFAIWGLQTIDQVTQTGTYDFTIVARQSTPSNVTFAALANLGVAVMDSKAIAAHSEGDLGATKWTARNNWGNGPYQLDTWQQGTNLVLKANPSYWGVKPYFSTVTLQIIPSSDSRVLLLKNGTIDIAEDLSLDLVGQLKGAAGVKVISAPSILQHWLGLVQNKPPFNDVRVRQAIAYSIDFTTLARDVLHGLADVTKGVWPQNSRWFQVPWSYKTDLAKSKSLMASAGLGSGFSFTCDIQDIDGDSANLAVALQTMLSAAGITMNISKLAPSAFTDRLSKRLGQAWIQKQGSFVDDPYYHLFVWFRTGGFLNWDVYSNPQLNDLRTKLLNESDETKRRALAVQAQTIMNEDLPLIPLADARIVFPMRSNVGGLSVDPDTAPRYEYFKRV